MAVQRKLIRKHSQKHHDAVLSLAGIRAIVLLHVWKPRSCQKVSTIQEYLLPFSRNFAKNLHEKVLFLGMCHVRTWQKNSVSTMLTELAVRVEEDTSTEFFLWSSRAQISKAHVESTESCDARVDKKHSISHHRVFCVFSVPTQSFGFGSSPFLALQRCRQKIEGLSNIAISHTFWITSKYSE